MTHISCYSFCFIDYAVELSVVNSIEYFACFPELVALSYFGQLYHGFDAFLCHEFVVFHFAMGVSEWGKVWRYHCLENALGVDQHILGHHLYDSHSLMLIHLPMHFISQLIDALENIDSIFFRHRDNIPFTSRLLVYTRIVEVSVSDVSTRRFKPTFSSIAL